MYNRILLPTDGSEYAERAAETGFDLAAELDASVFIVSVVDTGPLGDVPLPGDETSAESAFRERAEEFVNRLVDRGLERGLDVTAEIIEGTTVTAILDYADATDAGVIVMGSQGRGGVSRAMLGSVTDGVTRRTERDVLVVGDDFD